MFLNKATNLKRKLLSMTALRQAVILTVVFLSIVLLAGVSSILLIKSEIHHSVDQELLLNQQKIRSQINNTDIEQLQFTRSPLLLSSFKTHSGYIVGHADKRLFRKNGYFNQNLVIDREKDQWRILNTQLSGGHLALAINMEQRYEVLEIVVDLFALVGILSTFITLFTGLLIGFKNQRRFDGINNTLDKIAAGDLSQRINPSKVTDDLGQVAQHIDNTTYRLQNLLAQTKNLSANIAHDLKTPLARLRAQLEKALGENDVTKVQGNVEDALEQTDQLINIFEAILRIAHLNNGQQRERFKEYSLSQLVTESAEIYQAVIEDSQHNFALSIDSDFTLNADRELIIQLIANLLENAIRHTKEGSTITLSCHDNHLVVADNGPGIPSNMRDRVLEPMYRLEQSRHSPGHGLGLSMVATIAKLHNAHLTLADNNTQPEQPLGLKVTLVFS